MDDIGVVMTPFGDIVAINIQIKIAMSRDKLRILIKILVESHMAFDWEIKSTLITSVRVGLSVSVCSNVDFSFDNRRPIWFSNKIWWSIVTYSS